MDESLMKRIKIQRHAELRKEMEAVARGKIATPRDAGGEIMDLLDLKKARRAERHSKASVRRKARSS